MSISDWTQIHTHILQLEQDGLVTRTFRRLDPERQQLILTAILEEAVARGPAAINIKEVAHRAEVSIGSLYQYFENRAGLLAFAVELSKRYILDEFESFRPYLVALPLREGLQAYMMGGVEWSQLQIGLVQFFLKAAYQGNPELEAAIVRPVADCLRGMVTEILTAAVERGEVRPGIDLDATVRLVHALSIAAGDSYLLPYLNAYFQVDVPDVPYERIVATMANLIVDGIGADALPQE